MPPIKLSSPSTLSDLIDGHMICNRSLCKISRSEVTSYFYGYKHRPRLISHVHSSVGGDVFKLYYDDRDRFVSWGTIIVIDICI